MKNSGCLPGLRVVLALTAGFALAGTALARPGDIDASFGINQVAPIRFAGGEDRANAVAIQADGKIVMAGSAKNGSTGDFAIVRLNADGTPDASFGVNGQAHVAIGGADDTAYAVAIDSLGRIVVAGSSQDAGRLDLAPDVVVIRLTPSGSLDTAFGASGKFVLGIAPASTDIAYAVAIDAADRIVVAGRTAYYDPDPPNLLVNAMLVLRLGAGGALDESFGAGGGLVVPDAGSASALAVDAAGRIVVAAAAQHGGTLADFAVLRLDASGAPDPTFAGGAQVVVPVTTADDILTGVAVDSQGRVILAGYAEGSPFTGIPSGTDFVAVRLLGDGQVDASFGASGVAAVPVGPGSSGDFARAVAIDATDRIVLAGVSQNAFTFNSDLAIVRLTATGQPDGAFGSAGRVIVPVGASEDSGNAAALDGSGRIVVAGWTFSGSAPATGTDFVALRLTAGGALDAGFGAGGKSKVDAGAANTEAVAMAVQADDKVVVVGWCGGCGSSRHTAVARLTAEGLPDASFGGTGALTYAFSVNEDLARAVALDGAGRIVVAGDALLPGAQRVLAVARLSADGSPDNSFGTAGRTTIAFDSGNAHGRAIALDGAGRLLIAGAATLAGTEQFFVVRLLPNGTLDPSFGSGGKVRLDGVPPAGQSGGASSVLVDASGRVLLGGLRYVVRLLDTGLPDATFGAGGILQTLGDLRVHAMTLDAAGRVLLAGNAPNGASSFDLAVSRIGLDGNFDTGFGDNGLAILPTVSGGVAETAYAIRATAAGKILVAGDAVETGQRKFVVARLHPAGNLDRSFGSAGFVLHSPAPGSDTAFALAQQSGGRIVVAGTSGTTGTFATAMSVIRLEGGGVARHDFNADGRSDIFWRHLGAAATGENYLFPMEGRAIVGGEGYVRTVAGLDWRVAGVGDFDGDGASDVLWRNLASGQNYIFLMSGTTIRAEGYVRTVTDSDWQVAATGDFTGDGKDDILWRNGVTGQNYLYPMDGLNVLNGEGYIRTVAEPGWKIAGAGDFDGDGKADLLWRHATSGRNYLFPMDGTAIKQSEGYLRTVSDTSWMIAGVGDYDGDGKADVLWRHAATGQNYLYLMSGTSIAGEGYLRTVAELAWQVKGSGDYDGDGRSDVLWRNASSGQNYLFPMEGLAIKPSEGYIRAVPPSGWNIVGP